MDDVKEFVLRECLLRTAPRINGCVEWLGARTTGRYGRVSYQRKRWSAHRLFYSALVGPIPPHMEVMRKCDNPICVSPAHLTVGTHADNMRDKAAKGRCGKTGTQKQPHCMRGHPLSGWNLYTPPGTRRRQCRACKHSRLAAARAAV